MAVWPTQNIPTGNIDSGGDNPELARGDIKLTMENVNLIKNSLGQANGVAPTGTDNTVPAIHLPANLAKLNAAQSWTAAQAFQAITISGGVGSNSSSPALIGQFAPTAAVPGRFFIPITGSIQRIQIHWMAVTYNATAGTSQGFTWTYPFSVGYMPFITPTAPSLVKASATMGNGTSTYTITCEASPVNFFVLGIGLS